MLSRRNPFEIVLWVFMACSVPLVFSTAPLEKQAPYAIFVILLCAGLSVLIALGTLVQYVTRHRPCPKCGESSFKGITRVESGLYDDGSAKNPLAVSFDAEGNMYVRKYNRICRSCKHRFYVEEGGWVGAKDPGKPKLVFTKEFRDRMRAECDANRARLARRRT
jgi:hypothetical protein